MIVADMVLKSFIKFKSIIGGIQVYAVVFQGFPEPLDPYIVQGPIFAIHRYLDALLFKVLGPEGTVVSADLVADEDLRLSIFRNGSMQYIQVPLGTHRISDTPYHDLTAVHVHDHCHVHETLLHRDERDVGTPYQVGPFNGNPVMADRF